MRNSTLVAVVVILILAVCSAYIDWPTNPGLNVFGFQRDLQVKQGLDLKGGIELLLKADPPPGFDSRRLPESLASARDIIAQRVNGGLGVSEPVIQTQGNDSIIVGLPGATNEQEAVTLVGQSGQLLFLDTGDVPVPEGQTVNPKQYPTVLTGADLDTTALSSGFGQNGQAQINFAFKGGAADKFATYTASHIGKYLTITLDNKVIQSAVIQSQIAGQGQISGGNMTIDRANQTVIQLKYGALPVPLKIVSERIVGPTLGAEAIRKSFIAGIAGLSIVMLFMLIYYRLPGLLADIALILYAALTFAIFKFLGVVLTLAGIAGFILSIGMAVDANVLIFERLKEELRQGRTLAGAIEAGWKRAWTSIRDSNISTLITCAILFWFGSTFGASVIVGFATTLAIGVVTSLITSIFVTRTLVNLLTPLNLSRKVSLFGLPASEVRAPASPRLARGLKE